MRGRRPNSENVVPLTEEGGRGRNLDERAAARLEELRPEGLVGELRWTFDRLALPLCHPTIDRLNPGNVFMFTMLCRVVVRHERIALELDELGETYESQTRNGKQVKSRPEVAQFNETLRQIRAMANDFGMTPAAQRGLTGGGQLGFDFPGDDGPDGYLT